VTNTIVEQQDERFMRRALRLARRGAGRVSPNPLVGALIVRDGRIVGEGWHRHCGGPHAEIEAIRSAGEPLAGATFYVTLEPCSHQGRTPPCVEALIACRPARVVVGVIDPNPLVSGRGLQTLRAAGIETSVGTLGEACAGLNEVFFKYIRTGLPFVTLKFAQTLDGRIATLDGHSRWVSSPASLRFAHGLRNAHDAILVGANTVRRDDPELTCRHVRGRNPLRIVVDSGLALPPTARLFTTGTLAPTIVATTRRAPPAQRRLFAAQGIELLELAADGAGRVDPAALLAALGKREVTSLLVEGGGALVTSFLQAGLADRLIAIIAPKILGAGISAVGDLGIRSLDDALRLSSPRIWRRGGDLIFDARISRPSGPDSGLHGSRPGRR
jgi:diaminohydroxyphosphoribosylaminopyrimidine deaminase/5-amino-6-(5-phosphoribosylamino)uracil reductase